MNTRSFRTNRRTILVVHLLAGALLGLILLHPATMVLYWLEFGSGSGSIGAFIRSRMLESLSTPMVTMNLIYAFLGTVIGAVFGAYHRALSRKSWSLRALSNQLGFDVEALIRGGEDELTEFKSTVRWDVRLQRANRDLEGVVIHTIAGMMNHQGGTLLLGVTDDGTVTGLENDYKTLRSRDRDGFERLVMSLVRERIGAHACTSLHMIFVRIGDKDVCRVIIEPYHEPIYVREGASSRYYLRTGNATRELDVREALEHIRARRERSRAA